jgi:hypothetical protein
MFERFSGPARQAVVAGVRHAQMLGHGSVGPEHLLLGVLAGVDATTPGADRVTARVLGDTPLTYAEAVRRVRAGVSEAVRRGGLDETDVAALADLGIDVAAVVDRAEESFGPGALVPDRSGRPRRHRLRFPGRRHRLVGDRRAHRTVPLRPETRALLAGALVQVRDLGHRVLGTEHLLLAILASGRGTAYDLLREAGLDYLATRQAVMTELRRAS